MPRTWSGTGRDRWGGDGWMGVGGGGGGGVARDRFWGWQALLGCRRERLEAKPPPPSPTNAPNCAVVKPPAVCAPARGACALTTIPPITPPSSSGQAPEAARLLGCRLHRRGPPGGRGGQRRGRRRGGRLLGGDRPGGGQGREPLCLFVWGEDGVLGNVAGETLFKAPAPLQFERERVRFAPAPEPPAPASEPAHPPPTWSNPLPPSRSPQCCRWCPLRRCSQSGWG
jgi:hypothetical protein